MDSMQDPVLFTVFLRKTKQTLNTTRDRTGKSTWVLTGGEGLPSPALPPKLVSGLSRDTRETDQ